MLDFPAADGVSIVEQGPVASSVQPIGLNVPAAPLETEKATVPVGIVAVPVPVSVTVTVHVDAWLIATVEGVHETVVVVGWSELTVTLVVPLLLTCPGVTVSPGKLAVIMAVPVVEGVNVLMQNALPPVAALRAHGENVPVAPVAPVDNDTVPEGVVAPFGNVSVT